ncbi:DUF3307 domain-containing protein [Jeotgalibacillus sp. R-1-5s-1]|uniref:DUF3307 domain-containing protein n=1 Tax=Jeotgalibacillus sp. R-1-5s-1 TaxID=2555897 RepID=UPI00106B8DFA|nr:DUF3307 domain-containing protein [Jeotgalibacillus sp. R-1-5s-1]TFE01832.1 DUF3307 domain-containing protein [Jeotgalibacillus sp. R-1-5s-1]
MTPFSWLFLSHLIGDFLFQTGWMAANKASKWIPLLVHCAVYTLIVALISWIAFDGLSVIAILFIFITHVILDRQQFVKWWVKKVMQTPAGPDKWLTIVVDQIFHLIILAAALYL